MARLRSRAMKVVAVALIAALGAGVPAAGTAAPAPSPRPAGPGDFHVRRVCPPADSGPVVHCLATVRTNAAGTPLADSTPRGYTPADLKSAYRLPSDTAGEGHTVAIVVAYDYPSAEGDLAAYRSRFGLPPCTSANGCFRKVDQRGGTDYPPEDAGWALEASLDIDMVSATCPHCDIVLVEADDPSFDNIVKAVDSGARLGATEISNSYGAFEFFGEQEYGKHYDHPGVAVVAASGDFGYGTFFPATSEHVTAVGGTTLTRSDNGRGWSERAWDGAGSGCSAYIPKPAWQHDPLCDMRSVTDVSAVSDPVTGVAVYNTFSSQGWLVVGGTSAATPIIAGVYALAGSHSGNPVKEAYDHTDRFFDVTTWINGLCRDYLCEAAHGYDGPTGLGTPNGTGGF